MKQLSSSKILLGLPLLFLAGTVLAGPPVAYNGWSVSGGVIDTTTACSTSGITCTRLVEDDDFLIQSVKTADYEYIQYIVADANADGAPADLDFAAETFVPLAFQGQGITQGIASMQVVREAASGFDSSAELQRSMMRFTDPAMVVFSDKFNEPTPPEDMYTMKLSQTITDVDNGYVDTFDYTHYTAFATVPNMNPDSDKVIGRVLDITQRIDIGEAVDPAAKQQYFQHKRRMGVNGNIVTKPFWTDPNDDYYMEGAPLSTANNLTLGGTNVSWGDGAEIVSNWLAQELVMSDTTALTHQTIENRDTGAFASETDINADYPAAPTAWEPVNFGPAPSLP